MRTKLNGLAGGLWRYLREATGDDAYERYLDHHRAAHAGEAPLTRAQYYTKRQQEKWSGITRCC
ncbi:MAG TPA: YbdD/YjiX family protein [Burkholderiales bacterium]|nr:YbdD/YjiX family protein [Burkholderiales bacterium]